MKELPEYVLSHTERGECKCGKCADVGSAPDPKGHTVDIVFFKVAAKNNPDAARFKALTASSTDGEFALC